MDCQPWSQGANTLSRLFLYHRFSRNRLNCEWVERALQYLVEEKASRESLASIRLKSWETEGACPSAFLRTFSVWSDHHQPCLLRFKYCHTKPAALMSNNYIRVYSLTHNWICKGKPYCCFKSVWKTASTFWGVHRPRLTYSECINITFAIYPNIFGQLGDRH